MKIWVFIFWLSLNLNSRVCLPVCPDWISSDETDPLASCVEVSCLVEQTSHAQPGRTPKCAPGVPKPKQKGAFLLLLSFREGGLFAHLSLSISQSWPAQTWALAGVQSYRHPPGDSWCSPWQKRPAWGTERRTSAEGANGELSSCSVCWNPAGTDSGNVSALVKSFKT